MCYFAWIIISSVLSVKGGAGLFLSLKETPIDDDGFVDASDIGNNKDVDALLCLTNATDCCASAQGGAKGDWIFPNGNTVGSFSSLNTHSDNFFSRNRDQSVVRLNRFYNASERGRFSCELLNDTIYINILDIGPVFISRSPSAPITVSVEDNVDLVCSVDITPHPLPAGTSTPEFEWSFGQLENFNQSLNSTTTNSGSTYSSTLRLTSVSESDEGMYTCRLRGNHRTAVNTTIIVEPATTTTAAADTTTTTTAVTTSTTATATEIVQAPTTTSSPTTVPPTTTSLLTTIPPTTTAPPASTTTTTIATTVTLPVSGVYISHNGTVYPNNSVFIITDIGNTDSERLQCVTDRRPCCVSPNRVGEWYFPGDGGTVPTRGSNPTTFFRDRGSDDGTVNLNRLNDNVMMPIGQYCCVVPDATGVNQTVCAVIIPTIITVKVNSSTATPMAGSMYSLTCTVTGAERLTGSTITYQWFKDGVMVSGQTIETFTFTSLSFSDAGGYTCQATIASNLLGGYINTSRSNLVDITLTLPAPSITVTSNPTGIITAGSSLTLTCAVVLDPSVDVPVTVNTVWTGPDNFNRNIMAQQMGSTTTYTSTVMVSSFGRDQSGDYTCRATVSSNTSSFLINVTSSGFLSLAFSNGGISTSPVIAGSIGGVLALLVLLCIVVAIACGVSRRRNKKKENQYDLTEDIPLNESSHEKHKPDTIEIKSSGKTYDNFRNTVPISEFVEYVNSMHADRDDQFEEEFDSLATVPSHSHDVSDMPYNDEKNRFINIFPYDYNRIKLKEIADVEGSDYINASFLSGYEKQNAYIAAQGPLPNSLGDFWRMIWEQKLPMIVMLTKCFEDRKKCECYWPENVGEVISPTHDLSVELKSMIPFSDFVIRKMTVTSASDPPLQVKQLHFTAWPDHGVPNNTAIMLNVIKRVRSLHPYSNPRPLLVHCSAGVGRTGTFIVLDTMLERMKTEESFNIYEYIQQLREERVFTVQSLAQYMFIHDALKEFIMCGETEVAAPNLRIVVRRLGRTNEGISGFQKQFQTLDNILPELDKDRYTNATAVFNIDKNRYTDKLPCDGTSRTVLKWTGEQGSDYINASYINGYKQRRAYIATQGPLESTEDDFWRMVWEHKCGCVVMLCKLDEYGQEMSCHYWPSDEGEPQAFGKVTVKKVSQQDCGAYVTRKFEIDEEKDQSSPLLSIKTSFNVTQFQFMEWPEHESPSETPTIIELINSVNKVQMGTGNRPIVVMCNDGVGRTGTFICIHAQLERLKTEGVVDFFQFVKSARTQRPGFILNVDQYEFCHSAVLEYLQSCDTYANFKDVV